MRMIRWEHTSLAQPSVPLPARRGHVRLIKTYAYLRQLRPRWRAPRLDATTVLPQRPAAPPMPPRPSAEIAWALHGSWLRLRWLHAAEQRQKSYPHYKDRQTSHGAVESARQFAHREALTDKGQTPIKEQPVG